MMEVPEDFRISSVGRVSRGPRGLTYEENKIMESADVVKSILVKASPYMECTKLIELIAQVAHSVIALPIYKEVEKQFKIKWSSDASFRAEFWGIYLVDNAGEGGCITIPLHDLKQDEGEYIKASVKDVEKSLRLFLLQRDIFTVCSKHLGCSFVEENGTIDRATVRNIVDNCLTHNPEFEKSLEGADSTLVLEDFVTDGIVRYLHAKYD